MYKEGHKKFTSSIHTVFGTAMHEAMQHYLDVMYDKSVAAADRIDLIEYFNEAYIEEYKKQMKANNGEHFSSAVEMREFYEDGVTILDYFKKKRGSYFSKRKTHLVGCELPLVIPPMPSHPNTLYMGYLDVVLYNENTEKFTIIDIKTSTRGWTSKNKKDEEKQYQLKRATTAINDFIKECFSTKGDILERPYDKNPSKWNCGFCPYKEDKELCGAGTFL